MGATAAATFMGAFGATPTAHLIAWASAIGAAIPTALFFWMALTDAAMRSLRAARLLTPFSTGTAQTLATLIASGLPPALRKDGLCASATWTCTNPGHTTNPKTWHMVRLDVGQQGYEDAPNTFLCEPEGHRMDIPGQTLVLTPISGLLVRALFGSTFILRSHALPLASAHGIVQTQHALAQHGLAKPEHRTI